jgi:glycosyltransferase involved in cell wall biosynthesis
MKVVLVSPHYSTRPGVLERHVQKLAHGLARDGVTVEVLTQEGERGREPMIVADGVLLRRFSPPALWEHLRRRPTTHDVVHLHGAHIRLGLAVARAGVRRLVFTPHASIEHLSRWAHSHMLRTVVDRAGLAICASRAEADLLARALPAAANRVRVVPNGVDVEEIKEARPFDPGLRIVLAVGRLDRYCGMARAIAAIASLDPEFQLVVVGDGPSRRSLEAHAADLRVRSRVRFTGAVPDAVLYRWLRTAAVVVAPAERQASGVQVLEAVAAGAPVVASATPTHLETAEYLEEAAVVLVSVTGSPLELADAISRVSGARPRTSTLAEVPSWDAVVERTFELYRRVVTGGAPSGPGGWLLRGSAQRRGRDRRMALEG